MPWGPSFLTFAKICFLLLDLQAAYEIPVLTLEHCAVKHKSRRANSLRVRCLNQLRNNLKDRIKLTYKALKKPSKWLPLLCPLVGGGFLWSISSVLDGVGVGCLLLPGVWLISGFLFAAFLLAQLHCRLLVFWTLFALLAHRFTFSCGNWPLCGVWCLKQFQTMVIFRGKCKHFGRRSINIFRNERPPGREKSCCPTGFCLQISWLTPATLTQGSTPRELTELLTWARTARSSHHCTDLFTHVYAQAALGAREHACKDAQSQACTPTVTPPAFAFQAVQAPKKC